MTAPRVALIFPPLWYFDAVPADLSYPTGALKQAGASVLSLDLSSAMTAALLPEPTAALQQPETYQTLAAQRQAAADLNREAAAVAARFQVDYRPRRLWFPDIDEGSIPALLRVGLDPHRNPALPMLVDAVQSILAFKPSLVGIALVHPDQRAHALVLGRLLRRSAFQGTIALYGSYEDVITPEDFAADLPGQPRHHLFHDFNGVIVGESESALVALATGSPDVPNWFTPDRTDLPPRFNEDLTGLSPDFSFVQPAHHTTPQPVVDLRLGRGCPWGRCAFCAIQAHQVGYRSGPVERLIEAMERAHVQLGTRHFRIRDDLLTPQQLRQLGDGLAGRGFHWTARARFQTALTHSVLVSAAAGGLSELWLGLESAVARIRDSMDKGVTQAVILQNLKDAKDAAVPLRALCLVGFPGETLPEAHETIRFVAEHNAAFIGASLTGFMLTRRSPMAQQLDARGLGVLPDPVPRWQRLRHTLELEPEGHLGTAITQRLLHETTQAWRPLLQRLAGPSPTHDWLGQLVRGPTSS